MGTEQFKGVRTCISLPEAVAARAQEQMKRQGCKKFSAYITRLIQEDQRQQKDAPARTLKSRD